MDLDVTRLKEMHPVLAIEMAAQYAYQAAIGLNRHNHQSGGRIAISIGNGSCHGRVIWGAVRAEEAEQLDYHRVTEEAAEAISLALVRVAKDWVIRRRLQRGEYADWLLVDKANEYVALEISGIDQDDANSRRLSMKIDQVKQSEAALMRAACVVELGLPRTRLALISGSEA